MAFPIALRRLAVGAALAVMACVALVFAGEAIWLGVTLGAVLALAYALLDLYVRWPGYAERMAPHFPIRVSDSATAGDTVKLVATALLVVAAMAGLLFLGVVLQ